MDNGFNYKNLRFDKDIYLAIITAAQTCKIAEWNAWRIANPNREIWLQGATFNDIDLTNINLHHAHLDGASFINCRLCCAKLNYAHLDHTNFIDVPAACSNFNWACFSNFSIDHVNFNESSFHNTIFNNGYIHYSSFDNSDMLKAKFRSLEIIQTSFIETNLNSTNFLDVCMNRANFLHGRMDKIAFDFVSIINADLSNLDLYQAYIENSEIGRCNLESTKIVKSSLCGTNFFGSYVNEKTCLTLCEIDKDTDFSFVALDSMQIDPPLLTALKTNIRRKEWAKYYKKHPQKALFIKPFWWVSDYGSSTTRVIISFIIAIIAYTLIYTYIASFSQVIQNVQIPNAPSLNLFSEYVFKMFNFTLASLFTFSTSSLIVGRRWFVFAYFVVCCNFLTGYFLLAILVTRLSILSQSLAPEQSVYKKKSHHNTQNKEGQ